jgi:hypothetical protein
LTAAPRHKDHLDVVDRSDRAGLIRDRDVNTAIIMLQIDAAEHAQANRIADFHEAGKAAG